VLLLPIFQPHQIRFNRFSSFTSFSSHLRTFQGGFEDAGYPYEEAYVLATVCFFAGILLGKFFNWLAHWVREE
jgi:hypothetical protein